MTNKSYLEPQDIGCLIDAAGNLRDKLLATALFHLGCRVSEALGITVDDVDLDGRTVTIKHLKSRIKLKCPKCGTALCLAAVFCPKCGDKVEAAVKELREHRRQRVLPLDDELVTLLREYISKSSPVNRNGKRLLFGINRHRAWQIIKTIAEKAKLPRIINNESGKVHYVSPH